MSDLFDGLNEAQRQAVTHTGGPLLIVAGAGTGKTTVLAQRFAFLVREKGYTADNILSLTFTEKASAEMEDRILQLLPNGTYDFWISTFHRFCQRILEAHGLEIGLSHRFRVLNETDAWLLLKRHFDELPLDHYRPRGNPIKFLGAILSHISRAKDEGVTPETYLHFAQESALDGDQVAATGERLRLQELANIYAAYQRLLRQEDCLDFGDLIVETLHLFRERPRILEQYQKQFRDIMVDEFQDTNGAQYALIKLLAGDDKHLVVVGDDDQAIYKFRGASLANILQFRKDFPKNTTIALTTNYRSHQGILDTAYGFIQRNDPHRLETQLKDLNLVKRLQAAKTGDAEIESYWLNSVEDEADHVSQLILEAKRQHTDLLWSDVALLVRSNDGALPFLQTLERRGIPYQFVALRGLYRKSIILDIVALLMLADGRYDDATYVWRVFHQTHFTISVGALAACLSYAGRKGISLWSALKHAQMITDIGEDDQRKISQLLFQLETLAESARRESPLNVLQHVLHKTGLLSSLLKKSEGEKRELLNLLNTFAARIKRYEVMSHGPTLHGFLAELQLEIDSGEEGDLEMDVDAGPDVVKVMTIHASKGLEFRHVFVVSLVDQRFPTRERKEAIPLPEGLVPERLPDHDAHLEEERRLFYVAMTRAKERLVLTGASAYGGTRKKKPSVFFEEAGLDPTPIERSNELNLSINTEEVFVLQEEAERAVFPLKRRFSFTQLAAFRNCPLQYKFAHIYRLPVLGSFQKSFGQSIHLTLHDILKLHLDRGAAQQGSLFVATSSARTPDVGLWVTLDEASACYEARWIDEWYPTRRQHDEYKNDGRAAIKRLWEQWNTQPPHVRHLELPFDWRIGQHSIKGSVDRIDELPSGGVAIYDYKTGEPRAAEDLESGSKEQLRLYQIAMEERGMKVEKLAYIYVRDGSMAEVTPLRDTKRQAFIEELEGRMQAILSSRFLATPSVFTCQYCDFRNICEFRKS